MLALQNPRIMRSWKLPSRFQRKAWETWKKTVSELKFLQKHYDWAMPHGAGENGVKVENKKVETNKMHNPTGKANTLALEHGQCLTKLCQPYTPSFTLFIYPPPPAP
jgi:hypothetical protein